MGFFELFVVASMPIMQVLLISALGVLMATQYLDNILGADTRRSLNKIVFTVFTPSLIFANLAKTVTLQDMISWWFMIVNVGLTFLLGGFLGWIIVKVLKPNPKLEGLIIACCSAANLGNLPVVIIPAICDEGGSPFVHEACRAVGLSYASFSMALGGFFIWTYTYQLVRTSAMEFKALEAAEKVSKIPNKDLEADAESQLLKGVDHNDNIAIVVSTDKHENTGNAVIAAQQGNSTVEGNKVSLWHKLLGFLRQIGKELMAPPTLAAMLGFLFGSVKWLKNLIVGDAAPLRVFHDSMKLLGDGTIPCITLLLGGNLTQGIFASRVKASAIISVIVAKFIISPAIGVMIVKAAANMGLLPPDPLFQYVLMVQYGLPPAMNISTMTQFFDVGQEECSVLLLWTYIAAALALTAWSTVFMWILS